MKLTVFLIKTALDDMHAVDLILGLSKPKVCPRNNLEVAVLGVCVESCSHDSDCPNDEKCCHNGCGHQFCHVCITAKPGVCPSENLGVGVCAEMFP
uniref:WAP domain-containing protein n=1 Tax=Sinocyclocheilus anshuiensis TaxID=1608454 RepID=A0A671LCX1_9TELE